jgi:hypothetical protein
MVVGLIVTAYRLLSRRRPLCLRCSTPHVVVSPFLRGSTLSRCPGYATRGTSYPQVRLRFAEVFDGRGGFRRYGARGGFFDLLPKVELA